MSNSNKTQNIDELRNIHVIVEPLDKHYDRLDTYAEDPDPASMSYDSEYGPTDKIFAHFGDVVGFLVGSSVISRS